MNPIPEMLFNYARDRVRFEPPGFNMFLMQNVDGRWAWRLPEQALLYKWRDRARVAYDAQAKAAVFVLVDTELPPWL